MSRKKYKSWKTKTKLVLGWDYFQRYSQRDTVQEVSQFTQKTMAMDSVLNTQAYRLRTTPANACQGQFEPLLLPLSASRELFKSHLPQWPQATQEHRMLLYCPCLPLWLACSPSDNREWPGASLKVDYLGLLSSLPSTDYDLRLNIDLSEPPKPHYHLKNGFVKR